MNYLCECGQDFHSTWVFDSHRVRCIALRETLEAIPTLAIEPERVYRKEGSDASA